MRYNSNDPSLRPILDPLENRLLLSTVAAVDYPFIFFTGGTGLVYDASSDILTAKSEPVYYRAAKPEPLTAPPTFTIQNSTPTDRRSLTIKCQIDGSGALQGGVDGDDVVVVGGIDVDKDWDIDYYGTLLTGEIIGVFYLDRTVNTDSFSFEITTTFVHPWLEAMDLGQLGIVLTGENSTFSGSWDTSFSSGAKGYLGGIVRPDVPPAILGDLVWEDSNFNGIKDDGESGIPNVVVNLMDSQDNVLQTTTTDSSGIYGFTDLDEGVYKLEFKAPSGYLFTAADQGDDASDSDADVVSGRTGSIILSAGETDLTWDAGLYRPSIQVKKLVGAVQSAGGGEGLTPGYWKQEHHFDDWTGYSPEDSYNAVFGVTDSPDLTLLGALQRGGGGQAALGRHAVAALLNAAHLTISYAYTVPEIIAKVQAAYAAGVFEPTKDLLVVENERGADISDGGATIVYTPIDADTEPGLIVPAGTYVQFSYEVSAPGPLALRDVHLTDYGFNPVAVVTADHNAGDTDADDVLDVNEVWQYMSAPVLVTAGQHVNVATATGQPIDAMNSDVGAPISDMDPAYWLGVTDPVEPPAPVSLSGFVYVDLNDDGQIDAKEPMLPGVKIELTGTDYSGNGVSRVAYTDEDGEYLFDNLMPGTYSVTETQPGGFADGMETLGTVLGTPLGTVGQDEFSEIELGAGAEGINYNFGEKGSMLSGGQTATIGFWRNKNGQRLLLSMNGSKDSTALATWLAESFPNMFGDLKGKTNAGVANFYLTQFKARGQKLEAQVLATAFAVYATSTELADGSMAAAYGFQVTEFGTGSMLVNIGTCGQAFDLANYTITTVSNLLELADAQSTSGVLFDGNQLLRTLANTVFTMINETGDIG